MPEIAHRAQQVPPFHVMQLLQQAQNMEKCAALEAPAIIHLEVGEPDFPTPQVVCEAATEYLANGHVHYTPACGLPELRAELAARYWQRYKRQVSSEQIVLSTGASAALALVIQALVDPGDTVLMTDPAYPCNKEFVRLAGGQLLQVPLCADDGFVTDVQHLQSHWRAGIKVVMLASPANPTGYTMSARQLQAVADFTAEQGAWLIVDEIYQGLVYGRDEVTAVGMGEHVIVINSFSKYFGMTGWRLGWLVLPEPVVAVVERLAQNLYLAPPTLAQHAALKALSEPVELELQQRRADFEARRNALAAGLQAAGFDLPILPTGAFYLYVDCRFTGLDAQQLSQRLLHQAQVVATPGLDFGATHAASHIRFAYTRPVPVLQQAVARIAAVL